MVPDQSPCVTLGPKSSWMFPEHLLCLCFCDPPLPMARKCSLLGGGYLRTECQNSVGLGHIYRVLGGLETLCCRAWCGVVSPNFLGVVGNCPPICSSRHSVSHMSEHMCWNQLSEDPLLSLCSYPSTWTKLYALHLPFPKCLCPSSRLTLTG